MNHQFISSEEKASEMVYSEVKFKGICQLLKESWKIYTFRIKTFLGIVAIPVGFFD